MAAPKKNQLLVNKNFLMILFALIIILAIMTSVLLGVVVSDRRSQGTEPNKQEQQDVNDPPVVPDETTTVPTVSLYSTGEYTVNTTADSLNIRLEPNMNGEVITQIPKGATITIIAVNDSWGYTTYSGVSGWVSMQYLLAVPPQSSAAING